MSERPRIVLALPNANERAEFGDWLSADNVEPILPGSPREAADRMRSAPYDLLVADSTFPYREWLDGKALPRNPLTPTIVIGNGADEPAGSAVDGKTMYLARPVDRTVFVCFVTMALLEARPTRRSARKPVNPFDAFANGVPSHVVDVSNEGVRIEVPPDVRGGLPAQFSLRVPLIGVAVSVQRMWTQTASNRGAATWYGAALAENRPATEQAWRRFVEILPATAASTSLA